MNTKGNRAKNTFLRGINNQKSAENQMEMRGSLGLMPSKLMGNMWPNKSLPDLANDQAENTISRSS